MNQLPTILASAATEHTEEKADVLTALGIDWMLLIFQIIAFLILVFLLSKYIYPVFVKIIDNHHDAMEQSNKQALEAEKNAAKSREEMAAMLKEACTEAAGIVSDAKNEATTIVESAQAKSKLQAERIVAEAQEDIAKELSNAKAQLKNETVELVALATEKVVGGVINKAADKKLIEKSLKELES